MVAPVQSEFVKKKASEYRYLEAFVMRFGWGQLKDGLKPA
jgi:hypothetical protein